jgi:ribosome biogenesis GTPase A
LSRPPIAPKDPSNSPSVKLHRGKGNETTMMVKDRDDSTRHPVTKQWLSRFQNQQSDAPATPVADSTEKGMFTAGRK